jgi:hypothetical protein
MIAARLGRDRRRVAWHCQAAEQRIPGPDRKRPVGARGHHHRRGRPAHPSADHHEDNGAQHAEHLLAHAAEAIRGAPSKA